MRDVTSVHGSTGKRLSSSGPRLLPTSHDRLPTPKQVLLATREEELLDCAAKLKDARETSQKRQFVVDRLREAELRLCTQSEQLQLDLAAAASDITALFAAVEGLGEVQSGDRAAMRQVQQAVKVRWCLAGPSCCRNEPATPIYIYISAARAAEALCMALAWPLNIGSAHRLGLAP